MYVGSANLSGPALEDGIEWTVKLSEVEAPEILDRSGARSITGGKRNFSGSPQTTAFCAE